MPEKDPANYEFTLALADLQLNGATVTRLDRVKSAL